MSQSTTKGVMATAVHALVSAGLIHVDAPVAEYWPEFAHAGKAGVLVRHVLSHSAGLQKLRGRTGSLPASALRASSRLLLTAFTVGGRFLSSDLWDGLAGAGALEDQRGDGCGGVTLQFGEDA